MPIELPTDGLEHIKVGSADIESTLRAAFPHGAPEFIPTVLGILKLHSEKNHDYAHSDEDPLGNFRRVAGILKQYPGLDPGDPSVVCLIYLLKQFDAVLNMKAKNYEGKVEGVISRLQDVACYSLIEMCLEQQKVRHV